MSKKQRPDKIPAIRVPSDDCAVPAGGKTFFPHRGEWVEIVPGQTTGERLARAQVMLKGGDLMSAGLTDDAARAGFEALEAAMREICVGLAGRLRAWNWTDNHGKPLPPPSDPAVLRALNAHELGYLMTVGGE